MRCRLSHIKEKMGSRRVFDGAKVPIFQISGIKKAHLSALFLACVAKYNQLLRIEEALGDAATYKGRSEIKGQ